jgi:hypothetical protein
VDVPAESAVGAVVCGSRVDGDWRSSVQQSAERAEWSDAAGELFGDVQRYGERSDDDYAADSFHGAVELRTLTRLLWIKRA